MADRKKLERAAAPRALRLAAMGIEAECSLVVDDKPTRPEALFGSPRDFIRGELVHREGTSYHLPMGPAVYFDTGVIEVATPVIEIERGCAARAARSLWEAIGFLRGELDAWDAEHGLIKVNPLADWTLERLEAYIAARGVPVNPLHARGFPSIGCQPCTRALRPGEDLRAGRWWWELEDGKECGLHSDPRPVREVVA